jgi:hypothetical protein
LDAALRERGAKGYDMRRVPEKDKHDSVSDALSVLPRSIQRSLSNAQLSVLDSRNYDTSDKSAYDPMAGDRSKLRKGIEDSQREEAELRNAAEKAAETDALKANPVFGMF